MRIAFSPYTQSPLILSLSKDTRQGQPHRLGFDKLSLSGCGNVDERMFFTGGQA